MKEWISIKEACAASGLRLSTFGYWLKSRPRLSRRRPRVLNSVEINTEYFLKLCQDKYNAQQNGIGKPLQIKSPQEIKEALQKLA